MNSNIENSIAVFDSGIGGISVLNRLIELMPYENFVYYADSANFPYGKKSQKELTKIGKRIIAKFYRRKSKVVVIACNTMSTSDMSSFNSAFPQLKIIGTFPDLIHILKPNLVLSENSISYDKENRLKISNNKKKLLVIATTATCQSDYLADTMSFVEDFIDVYVEPADFIVKAVENGRLDSYDFRNDLKYFFKEYMDVDMLWLGCTHFPFAENTIREILGDEVHITSSCEISANNCYEYLSKNNLIERNLIPYIKVVDINLNPEKEALYSKLILNNGGIHNMEFSKSI